MRLNRAACGLLTREHDQKSLAFCSLVLLLFLLGWPFPGASMQNKKTRPPSLASPVGSSAADVLDRVIALAPPPLLPGENKAAYIAIAGRVAGASGPRDAIEEILIRDVIDLTWEVLRLRRIKAGILKASMGAGVHDVLNDVGYSFLDNRPISEKWAAGDESARQEVDAVLAKAALALDEVTAKTLEHKIDVFERLDRMLASAEARRNNALREIDRHRESLGAAARNAVDEVEDAEFRDVETGAVTSKALA
jgi:hypothetical protein